MGNLFYRTPPVGLIKKEAKFTNKEFCWRRFVENKLADYLTKHSVFLFEKKKKNSSCSVTAENTAFVALEPKIVDYDFLHLK